MATPALVVLLILTLFMCSMASAQDDSIVVVTTGEVLVLDCLVEGPSGDLDNEVVWFLDDVQVLNTSRLVLTNLNHTHHGSNITCYNETDVIRTRIIHFHHKLVLEVGKALILNCTTYPTAATNVTWHQSNKTATTDWVITDLDNVTSQLMIPDVTLDDTGLYSCVSSGGVTIRVFNISIGLFPQMPSSIDCSGCNKHYNFTCEWQKIPDTHLPTDVTYESKEIKKYSRSSWKECANYLGNGCHFRYGDANIFRLNVTNALGRLSIIVLNMEQHYGFAFRPPRIIGIEALSSSELLIQWTPSDCDNNTAYWITYNLNYTDGHTVDIHELVKEEMSQAVMVMNNANTEYCFRLRGFHEGSYGQWSNEVCTRTLPMVPNVIFDGKDFKAIQNAEEEGLRDIELTWKLVKIGSAPFQGVSQIKLEVNKTTIDETREITNRNTLSPSDPTIYTIDLEGRNDYSLEEDTFFYTIPGLSKYEDYTITLSAVNSAGSSNTTLKVGAQMKKGGFLVAALCVPLVILLIVALLAFGFQRLKNNSKPLPEPLYHIISGNVKPTYIEPEVFDELPAVAKEKQRQMRVGLSRESADSSHEYMDYINFTYPSSTPLNNSSLSSSAAYDTPTRSRASSSCSGAPQSNIYMYIDSPSTSNSPSTRQNGSAGYVTCEQFPKVQMPPPVADTLEQPSQTPAHVGTTLLTLSGNAAKYVRIAEMPMPAQRAYMPTDTAAQTQAPQAGSGSSDLGTAKMPQLRPAADLSQEPVVLEQEPLVGVHEQESQSGYQPQEEIPTTNLESIPESSLINESTNKGYEVCNGSVASHVGPDRPGTLQFTNGGYVSKEITNFPTKTEPSLPVELNNNGYVSMHPINSLE